MVLSDRDIKKALEDKRIIISPQPDISTQLGSCSIDLRLGNLFRIFDHSKYPFIDPYKKDYGADITREVELKGADQFIMQPGDFVLAVTMEKITIPDNLMGRLEGRSSLGRMGIVVHSTASIFDPGWNGKCVLELGNLGRMAVALTPGMRICAMTFEELNSSSENPYNKRQDAKYVMQEGPIKSKIHVEK